MDILNHRRKGIWHVEDTEDESTLSYKQLLDEPNDFCYTAHHRTGLFCVYSKDEFEPQIRIWKKLGVKILMCNIREIEIDGKPACMFTAQPEDDRLMPFACPLAIAHGVLVSGYTYICRTKRDAVEVAVKLRR